MDYTEADRRPFWSDIQTSEQNYGIISFDPGKDDRMIVEIDGESSDWDDGILLADNGSTRLYVKQDARYLYLCIKKKGLELDADRFIIPVDITPKSGYNAYDGYEFDFDADFVIDINGKENSTVLTHSYYDRYAFLFGPYDNLFHVKKPRKRSKDFDPIYLCLNRKMILPATGKLKDAEREDTGKLLYGNGKPHTQGYDSLSDFCAGKDFVEIRIPWGILSFRDPSTKLVEDDFWENKEIKALKIEGIKLGLSEADMDFSYSDYTWEDWDEVEFFERPKESYYTLRDKFAELKLY